MSPSLALSGPQVLIFDTGPLWELLLYSAVHTLRYAGLKGDLQYVQTASSYERFSEFIDSFTKKTTTAHVVAEISAWIKRTERKGQSAIWGLVYTEFRSMRMDEGVL